MQQNTVFPDFPIVDSHCHFWDKTRFFYSWLEGVPLAPEYLPSQVLKQSPNLNLESAIFVECVCDYKPKSCLDEALWVNSLARENPFVKGIVAAVPFGDDLETLKSTLESLKQNALVTGVRRVTQGENADFVLTPKFIEGVSLASSYGYSIDVCLKGPNQQESANKMIDGASNDIQWILDHAGKPLIKEKLTDPWRDQLNSLAKHQNVCCKISGLITEADHQNWTATELKPYIDHVIGCFGIDRVLYGSDWPVGLLGSKNYESWVSVLWEIVSKRPQDEKRKLFRDNAIKIYL